MLQFFYQYYCINGEGGAIYFNNGLDFKLNQVCGSICFALNRQFAYIRTLTNKINSLNMITISKCYNESINFANLFIQQGIQTIFFSNCSFNINKRISSFQYHSPDSMFSKFITFYNNSVTEYIGIYLNRYSGTLFKSNIIKNNSPISHGVVYVSDSGNYILDECIFQNNFNILLYVFQGSLTLNNCFSDKIYITYGTITNNLIISSKNSYLFTHYNTNFIYLNKLINCNIELNHFTFIFKKKKFSFIYLYSIIFFS